MRRSVLFLLSLTGGIIVLSIVQICISNAFSTDGIAVGQMQQQIADLNKENILLKEKVDTLSSLTNIEAQARALGFTDATSQLVVGNPQPLAIRQ